MGKWIKNEIDSLTLEFTNGKQSIKAPKIIGNKYVIEKILSIGGNGVIFVAKNKSLKDREVLVKAVYYSDIKLLVKNKYDESRSEAIINSRKNLELESKRLISFRNGGESRMPSVIDVVYDYSPQLYGPHKDKETGEIFYLEEFKNNEVYVIMQKIDGINLGEYISKGLNTILEEKNYSSVLFWERDVLEYMKEVSNIIDNFHRREYVDKNYRYYIYQDLKPSNIMITYDKFITLIDFGGLLMVGNIDGKTYSDFKNEGIPGCGTIGYAPREMEEDPKKLDARVDIYTIGATIYSLLTTKSPLDGVEGTTKRIPVYKLKDMGYSQEVVTLVEKATSLDRENRQISVRKLINEITGCLRQLNTKINKMQDKMKEIV